MQANSHPLARASWSARFLHHGAPLLGAEQRRLAGVSADRGDQAVGQPGRLPHHIQVAVGDGIERSAKSAVRGMRGAYHTCANFGFGALVRADTKLWVKLLCWCGYPLAEINRAAQNSSDGTAIKAVLRIPSELNPPML